ncbi:GDSL-type esterase/lipase family protein [Clostridium sp. Mt-5]|uniref:GDSL-type esterase/lipase family protein n=1 Tax=Clostridium moutaii TaxID=3240932 RepID=A0ABV4BQM1_9CLOT
MKLVCLGDSVTYGYGVKRSETWTTTLKKKLGVEVINKGIAGDTSAGMLSRVYNDVILNNPTHTIIMGGVNDFVWNLNIDQAAANLATIAFQLMQNNIIPIFGLSIPICSEMAKEKWDFLMNICDINNKLKKLNSLLKSFCKNYNIQIIDFYSFFIKDNGEGKEKYYIDGLHLNVNGNEKMVDIIFNTDIHNIISQVK